MGQPGRDTEGSWEPGIFTPGLVGRTLALVSAHSRLLYLPLHPAPSLLPGRSPGHLPTSPPNGPVGSGQGLRGGGGCGLYDPPQTPADVGGEARQLSRTISVPGEAGPQGWTRWPGRESSDDGLCPCSVHPRPLGGLSKQASVPTGSSGPWACGGWLPIRVTCAGCLGGWLALQPRVKLA